MRSRRIETDGPLLEGRERRLDLGETVVNLLRQLVGFRIGLLELFVFGLKCFCAAASSSAVSGISSPLSRRRP